MISKACVVAAYRKKLEELARLGEGEMELTLIVPPSWRDERGSLPLERASPEGYEILVEKMALNGHFHLSFYPGLGQRLRQLRPDLVHIDEEPYNLATFQAMRLAGSLGARAIFFTWQNLYRRYPPPFNWVESYNFRHAACAIAGSREAEEVLRRKGYKGTVAVIPQFGVDPEVFRPRPRAEKGPFSIGYVGRLVEEKGVDLILRAVAGLDGEWRLRILGHGPERAKLGKLAARLNIEKRVTFEPALPSKEMPGFLSGLDVLVLPSRTRPNWKEQFGRALVEAMACGVPVIGSDSGEIPHVIGEAGLVFPEEDVEGLRAFLQELMKNPARLAELSRKGRARVLAHYTQRKIASATYRVYLACLRESQRF
ncbi:MAG: glycosyltransferase [Anaerolineae bacterium]